MSFTSNRRLQNDTIDDTYKDKIKLGIVLALGGHGHGIYDYGPGGSLNGLLGVWDSWIDYFFARTSNTSSLIMILDERDFKRQNYTTSKEEYMNRNGKELFPSEFILYSYLAKNNFEQFNSKPRSFLYVVPDNIKNENEILVEIVTKTLKAERNPDITSFAFHPLIFEKLSDRHINYINKWLSKLNFSFQFTLT
jgi:hypothetical protein